ncbi:hypothetical protein AXE80_05035 [Wenyingzhuangia fucanilytica]|uniref:DUF4249 domain-containing protein n=1 Tax=Wenyingzhuangia fucanilytica TaxID=1790137 RepID=A0A1B1Y4L3_9FLAO|nr:DUF4249 family protein [Wenyingzhuangia fucanilytica]ANW95678.1 hypothetical protein AXE80_05035 [Wenyingzhuangia fucanilytica]
MKTYIYLLLLALLTISCTEEIIIDELNNVDPKLVIEANIDIDKNANSRLQTIKLTQTTSYYNQSYPQVLGASISITDEDGNSMGTFLDINPGVDEFEDGIYTSDNFDRPEIGKTYYLTVIVDGETYTAHDTFTSISKINFIDQKTVTFPDETIQLNINVENEKDVDNYYLNKIETPYRIIPEYSALDDQEYDDSGEDNHFDIAYIDDELEANMNIDITLYGISKGYKNYLDKVLSLAQGSNGPFSTAPASVRGNILNTTNKDNYALGYFSVNQYIKESYIVK